MIVIVVIDRPYVIGFVINELTLDVSYEYGSVGEKEPQQFS